MDMDASLDAPPLHHILDNAVEGLHDACPSFSGQVERMSEICKLLGRRSSRTKLLARCYDSPVGRNFHPQLKAFKGQ
eukprot:8299996-Alexandrium_andersonii.AAC.1